MSNLQLKILYRLIKLTGNELEQIIIGGTILVELANGNLIEGYGFCDTISQVECLVN